MLANQCPKVLQIHLIEWCSFVVHGNGAVTQTFTDIVKARVRFVVRQRHTNPPGKKVNEGVAGGRAPEGSNAGCPCFHAKLVLENRISDRAFEGDSI